MLGTCDTKRGVQRWRALVLVLVIVGLLVILIADLKATASNEDGVAVPSSLA